MGKDILDILNNLSKPEVQNINNKVLLIDGLNLYIRAFSANGAVNDMGVPVGGIIGFMKSLALLIREIDPTRIIIAFDGAGGSYRRRKLYPQYKNNRIPTKRITRWDQFKSYEDERNSMKNQLARLLEYLEFLPITQIMIDKIEADDVIAYITNEVLDESEIYIISADKDFLQLIDDRVTVWSSTKKKFYTPSTLMDEYGIPCYNFLLYRVLLGDQSDNLPGVRGLGPKKITKIIPGLIESPMNLNEVYKYSSKHKTEMHKRILESEDQLDINYQIMTLKDPIISGNSKMKIMDNIDMGIRLFHKNDFIRLFRSDRMGQVIPNIDLWLNEYFGKLTFYAKAYLNGK